MEFSVLIAVYDEENAGYFEVALHSVIHQTLVPNEIVLVVDGPVPAVLDQVIEQFDQSYPGLFHIIRLPKNVGLGEALRIGVLACKYELVARMDSDDISLPDRFQKQLSFLNVNESIAVVGTNMEESNITPGDSKVLKTLPEEGSKLASYAKYRNPLNHPTVVFRKAAVLVAGNYSGEIRLFEDYMLWIRMLLLGYQCYNIQEPLLYFRVGDRLGHIKRRSGMHYLKKEIRFLRYARRWKYLNRWEFAYAMSIKPIIRLLPVPIVLWAYEVFLRRKR